MQTSMKTKRKLQKIQPLTLLYTIFDEKGPLSHTFYQWMVPLPHIIVYIVYRTLYPF